jgi:hypothetical protein
MTILYYDDRHIIIETLNTQCVQTYDGSSSKHGIIMWFDCELSDDTTNWKFTGSQVCMKHYNLIMG